MSEPTQFTPKQIWVPKTAADLERDRIAAERRGSARDGESCEQRNMRMGWGRKCHGMTFCPDLVCVGYEDDVPIFERKARP